MYHQLATLKRRAGDDEAAAFAEKEAKRLAKKFVTELDRVGTWAVYEEDADFLGSLLGAEVPTPRTPFPPTSEDQTLLVERPTRRWADD